MVRTGGRAPKATADRPRTLGPLEDTTFTAGLRRDGLVAPFILDGPMNGEAFLVYVEKILVPALRPGDIGVMNNLARPQGPRPAA